ncbi:hypothetical protein [Glycomyces tenuis]|uniref:hypothetical protein n=1 Tax=Glycomyces tenuis TaxID=58116 RepID=UPI00047D900D|nr:hypothetical protein [Glycomyces tenuis]
MSEDYTLDDVPPRYKYTDMIDGLEPAFVEAYSRKEGADRYPDIAFLINKSQEQIDSLLGGGEIEYYGDGLYKSLGQEVRWSEITNFFLPYDADTSVDSEIMSIAEEQASSDITSIHEEFLALLDECDVIASKSTLSRLTHVADSLTELIEKHENNEFAQVEELFETWKGDDADSCFETFGSRLRGATGLQRRMLADLISAASAEASAQAMALCTAYNTLVGAYEVLAELQNSAVSKDAFARLVGTFLVNRVPYLGDAVALADFTIEVHSDGATQGGASGMISRLISKILKTVTIPPPPDIDTQIGEWLRCAPAGYLATLEDERASIASELGTALSDWSAQDLCSIAPGAKD